MLTLALAATLLGFVLLILGLITGTVWLAVACIVVCLVGLGFLLVDVFAGRKGDAGRSLEDMVPGARRDVTGSGAESSDDGIEPTTSERGSAGDADAPTRQYSVAGHDGPAESGSTGYRPGDFEPGMAAPGGAVPVDRPASGRPAPERREGNLEDYLRSVGADAPAGDAPFRDNAPEGPVAPGGRPGPADGQTPPRYGSPPPGAVPQRLQPGSDQQWSQQPGPRQSRPQQQPGPPQPGPQQAGDRRSGPPQAWGQRPPAAPSSPGPRPFDPAQSGWVPEDVPGGDTAGGDDWATPSERSDVDSPPRRRRADFDPLDPNWHPPPS
ncbi:hypothetical protein [Gordonia sp. NPDC058843]|uniref:hypothetical protein n=1 Tax=Gordonia sp. NPDC058843 TaxID=3346648 RepID=UPI00369F97AD